MSGVGRRMGTELLRRAVAEAVGGMDLRQHLVDQMESALRDRDTLDLVLYADGVGVIIGAEYVWTIPWDRLDEFSGLESGDGRRIAKRLREMADRAEAAR